MAQAFTKYREAKDSFTVAFTNDLAAGENLTTAIVVVEHLLPVTGWEDVSETMLGTTNVTATEVTFMLVNATTEAEQPVGTYRIIAKGTTDGGRILVGEIPLTISA